MFIEKEIACVKDKLLNQTEWYLSPDKKASKLTSWSIPYNQDSLQEGHHVINARQQRPVKKDRLRCGTQPEQGEKDDITEIRQVDEIRFRGGGGGGGGVGGVGVGGGGGGRIMVKKIFRLIYINC